MDFLGSVVAAKTAIFVLVIPELHYAIGKRLPKGDGKAVAAFFDDLESAIALVKRKWTMPCPFF